MTRLLPFALSVLLAATAIAEDKPNVVVIMADDLGWNAVGYHNPEVKTPNLNRLCKEGIELDNFYVSPMCTPTRAGFLTGRYPIRFGLAKAVIPPWRDFGLSTEEVTLADALGKAGYPNRGIFGKWHLGHARKKWLPTRRGFTESVGCYNGAIDYFTLEREGERDWHENDAVSKQRGYATTLTGQAASKFIEESAKKKEPFFCYVPFNAPHSPFQAPEKYLERYSKIKDKRKRTYYAMITAMDDEIGRILKAIDDAGIRENTIVWFFSDNGGVKNIAGNNKPLHGAKLSTYEGGVRAAACVRFPSRYPGGKTITERTAFIDVMPTILPLAGTTAKRAGCKPLDGVNLDPLLSGKAKLLPERDLFFYHGQSGEESQPMAIISGDWKLVTIGSDFRNAPDSKLQVSLFKISVDPNETRNLANGEPEVLERLMEKLIKFRKLQPGGGIPVYGAGRKGFKAPKDWNTSGK